MDRFSLGQREQEKTKISQKHIKSSSSRKLKMKSYHTLGVGWEVEKFKTRVRVETLILKKYLGQWNGWGESPQVKVKCFKSLYLMDIFEKSYHY